MEDISSILPLITGQEDLEGLNVTIPHKVNVMPFLHELDDAARQIGAVNCISIRRQGNDTLLKGYNTDAFGFEESLKPYLKEHHTKALILGDGGAAKAVRYVLGKLNISYLTVVRTAVPDAVVYGDLNEDILGSHQLIINTTPLGTFPKVENAPDLPYHLLTAHHLAYDLVYNPEETEFLRRAKARGAAIKNGLEMLHLQADRSWMIWNSLA